MAFQSKKTIRKVQALFQNYGLDMAYPTTHTAPSVALKPCSISNSGDKVCSNNYAKYAKFLETRLPLYIYLYGGTLFEHLENLFLTLFFILPFIYVTYFDKIIPLIYNLHKYQIYSKLRFITSNESQFRIIINSDKNSKTNILHS